MRMVLLGPPGAGKGTQATFLQQHYAVPWWSMGSILRSEVGAGTEIGKAVDRTIQSGALVPDQVVRQLIFDRLSSPEARKGFVLDGFPRNVTQAEAFDAMLEKQGVSIDAVVEIRVDSEALAQRISGRYFCTNCMEGYHDVFKKPVVSGVCDRCGSVVFDRRSDDSLSMVRQRLQVYQKETEPLVSYYKERGILLSVDGMEAIEEVSKKIIALLEGKH